jgi:signal transduction histidine kinase
MAGVQAISGNPDLELVSLLNIEEYQASSRQLRNLILATLAAVSLLGAIVAVLVSRRISQPLSRLAQAAAALRGGDLKTPLSVPSRVWEVNQLTNALEDARVSLKHSLEQLHKEKAWIESLLNSIVEGLLTLNEHARVTFASEGIQRITGLNTGLMLGRPVDDFFITPADEEDFSAQLPAPNQSRRVAVTVNGHATLLAVSASEFVPPEAGNASRALLIRDVSDEERIHRLMGDFMANITHEFRTPLSALAASVELLLEQLPDLSPQEIEDLLHSLNVGIISLQSLIDNLLEAASIETGRFKVAPHPVELNTIIAEAVATVQPISDKYGLSIKSPKNKRSLRVLADTRRTAQAMVNLFSNAIKHSPEGGVIEVIPVIVDSRAVIEVTDQGLGIPQGQRERLFHRFAALADDSDNVQPGFGLGLSVVKAIIEAQHGEVGFSEQSGGGSRFWFSLPLADEEPA